MKTTKIKSVFIMAILMVFTVYSVPGSSYAQYDKAEFKQEILNLKNTSRAFVAVSKAVTPAVVSVRTEGTVRTARDTRNYDDLYEQFRQYFPNIDKEQFKRRQQETPTRGLGSGVIISSDGYIITNNHVVEDAEVIKIVMSDQYEYIARLIGSDRYTDIALVKIDVTNLPIAELGSSEKAEVGEWVLAIGNPFQYNLSSTVTAGIISAIGRDINVIQNSLGADRGYAIENFIQTDAAINPGNSGGPLVNLDGRVIGINSAIISRSGGYQGYGFAIPIDLVKTVVEDLKKYGKFRRALIGVSIRAVTTDDMEAFGLDKPDGALVSDFSNDESPAIKAGIEKGDVIVAIDGKKIKRVNELQSTIAQKHPGDIVNLTVVRDGDKKNIPVKLTGFEPETERQEEPLIVKNKLNFEVEGLSRELASQYGYRGVNNGVIVSQVRRGSSASEKGLQPGHIVWKIGRKYVRNMRDYEKAINSVKDKSKSVAVFIKTRNGNDAILSIKLYE